MVFQKGHQHYEKRKVKDEDLKDLFLVRDPDFIKNLCAQIKAIQWPYAKDGISKEQDLLKREHLVERRELLQSRYQGLAALLVLIGPRISEALAMQRKMFVVCSDRIEVMDFRPGKNGNLRTGLFLPLNSKSALFPITQIFMSWLTRVKDDPEAYMFPTAKPYGILRWNTPMERGRAH